MKWILPLFISISAMAQTWGPGYVPWNPSTCGINGGIPARSVFTNFVTAGADPTGRTNCGALMTSLIGLCGSNQVVYCPTGYYSVNSVMNLGTPIGKGIRGDGPGNTYFIDNSASGLFSVGAFTAFGTFTVLSGATQGSSNLIVGDTSPLVVGKLILIQCDNPTNFPVINTGGGSRIFQQTATVTALSNGTNVAIWPPLYMDMTNNPTFQQNAVNSTMFGFDGFSVIPTNPFTGGWGTNGLGSVFTLQGCNGVYITNVSVDYIRADLTMFGLLNWDIEHSTFDFNDGGVGAGNGHVFVAGACSGGLYRDNISVYGSPDIELDGFGNCGNAFLYNFSYLPQITGQVGVSIASNHGGHNFMNLYEGNIGEQINADAFFGSASHCSIFRNYWSGYTPQFTNNAVNVCISLSRWTTHYSMVGNILGSTNVVFNEYQWTNGSAGGSGIYKLGFPNQTTTGYGGTNPPVSFNYPGPSFFICTVTNDSINTTNLTGGNFINVNNTNASLKWFGSPLNQVRLQFQSAGNTNFYYPLLTSAVPFTNGSSNNVFLVSLVSLTNGDSVYVTTPTAYQQYQMADLLTDTILDNYDTRTAGVVSATNVPASLFYTSQPSWAIGFPWPMIGPDVAGQTNDLSTVSNPAMARFFSTPPPGGPGTGLNAATLNFGSMIFR